MSLTEDIAKYVEEQGPRKRGKNRAAILAIRTEIAEAISDGWTILMCWEVLTKQEKVTMSYQTFRTYVNKLVVNKEPEKPAGTTPAENRITPKGKGDPAPSMAPETVEAVQPASPPRSGPLTAETKPKDFSFNPKPKKGLV